MKRSRSHRLWPTIVLVGALTFATACGGDDSSSDNGSDSGNGSGAGSDSGENALCDTLTDEEITDAIGEHEPGTHDYVFGGCVWTASAADADGFTASIHAAQLPADQYESVAEIGEPIDGFGEGATYDDIHGELWFPCGDAFCGIKAGTADSGPRQDIATRLAQSLRDRV
ncbi:hypothetical protein [Streptomyces sp. PT12]|uniref:hypothetical protein n=1 Tax=Streptomyces sp. PT12 TaxID=1510197 RepID=UPI000DE26E46|nr:hypothetical protein [Streptomyces sp. PT12]RBM18957.1 hypothetical protein DEH69_11010 [Streptomyces sp. PT12]